MKSDVTSDRTNATGDAEAIRQRRIRNAALFSTLGIVIVGAVVAVIVTVHPTSVQAPAPDFTLSRANGQRVRLSDYRGRVALLEFFATWCPHCKAEARYLPVIFSMPSPKDYAFFSVNADSEDAASLHAFERWFKLPWPSTRPLHSPDVSAVV